MEVEDEFIVVNFLVSLKNESNRVLLGEIWPGVKSWLCCCDQSGSFRVSSESVIVTHVILLNCPNEVVIR